MGLGCLNPGKCKCGCAPCTDYGDDWAVQLCGMTAQNWTAFISVSDQFHNNAQASSMNNQGGAITWEPPAVWTPFPDWSYYRAILPLNDVTFYLPEDPFTSTYFILFRNVELLVYWFYKPSAPCIRVPVSAIVADAVFNIGFGETVARNWLRLPGGSTASPADQGAIPTAFEHHVPPETDPDDLFSVACDLPNRDIGMETPIHIEFPTFPLSLHRPLDGSGASILRHSDVGPVLIAPCS